MWLNEWLAISCADRASKDFLDKIRCIPERVISVVYAGIVHVPVARPQRVPGRTGHSWVRESVRRPSTAFQKMMTDGGPCYGDSVAFEDLQKVRNILPFLPSFLPRHLLRMLSKSPTQFEIRHDTCCSSGIVFERRDCNAITGLRFDTSLQIPFQGLLRGSFCRQCPGAFRGLVFRPAP